MKQLILRITVAFAFLCSFANLSAQWVEATGGSVTFDTTTSVASALSAGGVTYATYCNLVPTGSAPGASSTYYAFNAINSATVNSTTGEGLVSLNGEIDFISSTVSIRIDQLTLQNLDPSGSGPLGVTGNVFGNGHSYGRMIIFNLGSNPLGAPFTTGNYVITLTGNTTVSSDLSTILNSAFGITITSGTQFGGFSLSSRFAAVS